MGRRRLKDPLQGGNFKQVGKKMTYLVNIYDENDERHKKYFSGKDEAECLEKAAAYVEKIRRIVGNITPDSTIPEILREKLSRDFKKNYINEPGYAASLGTIRSIETGLLGMIPIREIDEEQMDLYLQSLTSYSNHMIQRIYQMLRMAFEIAKERHIIKKNIMTNWDLRCPKSEKRDRKIRGLREDEQQKLVHYLQNYEPPYGRTNHCLQLLLELYTGMRMGEINALTPEDIDFKRNVISVHRTVSTGLKGRVFIKETPKTETGIREVPISDYAYPVIKEALRNMRENPLNLIFSKRFGDPIIRTGDVTGFYKRCCENIGIEYNGQHALRHTFATRCIEAGVPPIVLKTWLGHKNIHITLDTYADVFERLNHDAINLFSGYLNRLEGETTKQLPASDEE